MAKQTTSCRACGHPELTEVLSLGRTPLANALLTADQLDEPEATYPLDLVFCSHCSLVQITETVPPERLFSNYVYFSSYSDTLLQHAKDIVQRILEKRSLQSDSLVVEIASNDGYLLQYYRQAGVPVLGIEPAANVAKLARERRGIPTICGFFGKEVGESMKRDGFEADVIHANNVLAHVADLNGFVHGLRLVLKDDGVMVIEVPYVKDLIDHCEFDTIYHEHLCYFSLTSLNNLFQRHSLCVCNVERISIHGGSLRVFVSREGSNGFTPDGAFQVSEMIKDEARWGADRAEFYQGFGERVERLRRDLCGMLRDARAQGKRIAAYGASAKGSTLLNYFGIGSETLDFVVDRSTVKQGYYTPGTHLPIYSPEKLLELMPDYVLLLTWNFADEILSQQDEFRRLGGHFILPIPEMRVV